MNDFLNSLLWVAFPYIALATMVVGIIWRYRYDKFRWTTRSSQIYETKMLRVGGPMFHLGILMALGGHLMGLVIPKAWTDAVGIDQHMYHMIAVGGGVTAGLLVTVGFLILLFRRMTNPRVRQATSTSDKFLYLVLTLTIIFGMWNTISTALSDQFNYRESVSPYFRSVFMLNPDGSLMANVPFQFKAHVFLAFLLLMIWPFTRLVHALTIPLGYLTRPYIVFRTLGDSRVKPGVKAPQGTWDKASTKRVKKVGVQ